MDTENLRAFVAVAQAGSFSLAAESLFLTQPAVSKRIASLEHRLEASLFDRIGRNVSLTEAGRELLPRAKSILNATDQALQAINDLSGDVRGDLKLTTSHHMGLHHLPAYLRRFADTYPAVKISLDFQDSEVALEQVISGQAELAALTMSAKTHEKLIKAFVWDDPLVLVAAKDHPLANLKCPTLTNLAQYAAILPEKNTFTTQLVTRLFHEHQLHLETRMATNYLETVKMLVTIGLGWGVLPKSMINKDELQTIPALKAPLIRTLGIVHHRDRQLSNASKAFLGLFK